MNIDFTTENTLNFNEEYNFIDVSVQQRNNRKCWTVISNLNIDDDKKKILLQSSKKKLSCNGTFDENNNLRLTGDHKQTIIPILCQELSITKNKIRTH